MVIIILFTYYIVLYYTVLYILTLRSLCKPGGRFLCKHRLRRADAPDACTAPGGNIPLMWIRKYPLSTIPANTVEIASVAIHAESQQTRQTPAQRRACKREEPARWRRMMAAGMAAAAATPTVSRFRRAQYAMPFHVLYCIVLYCIVSFPPSGAFARRVTGASAGTAEEV